MRDEERGNEHIKDETKRAEARPDETRQDEIRLGEHTGIAIPEHVSPVQFKYESRDMTRSVRDNASSQYFANTFANGSSHAMARREERRRDETRRGETRREKTKREKTGQDVPRREQTRRDDRR